jgi:hypothetical protein
MKKRYLFLFVLLNISVSLFAKPTYKTGIDVNMNDIGVSLTRETDKFNIKATASYPLFAILDSKESFDEATLQDFFETICLHGTINYNLISYNSFFFNLGLASDVFMQFDFSNEHSHYTCFTVGPIGEIGYSFKKNNKENLNLSFSVNLPIIALENKTTNLNDGSEEEAWNELINHNYSLFYMVSMVYKVNFSIPF